MTVGELRPPSTEDPLLGQVISDRYRIIKKLGEGGMGAVYLAEHVFIEKKVALKVLAPELARRQDLAIRFLQEARAASSIGQENIIDISDFGQTPDGTVFFAMEVLDGKDLGVTISEGGPLPWSRAKRIVLQICKALRAAHARGVVHRDMKPENIFILDKEGRLDFVKVLDFGIAKVQSMDANAPKLTRTGMIFGTPEYMAPEQAEGKEADHRVDIYAVGCVIYHVMTGTTPFTADSFMAMLTKHLLEEPIAPGKRYPELNIPKELDAVVLRALEKDRDRRWRDMDELMGALAAIGDPTDVGTLVPPKAQSGERPATVVSRAVVGSNAHLPASTGPTTRQLGGSSEGLKVITTTARVSDTHIGDATVDLPDGPASRRAAAPSRAGLWLVIVGVMVGVTAAVAFVLSRKTPAPMVAAPAVVAPPAPMVAAPPVVAPPVAAPPVAAPSPEPARVETPSRDRRKPGFRRITAPDEPAAPKPGMPTPRELKNPFPGSP